MFCEYSLSICFLPAESACHIHFVRAATFPSPSSAPSIATLATQSSGQRRQHSSRSGASPSAAPSYPHKLTNLLTTVAPHRARTDVQPLTGLPADGSVHSGASFFWNQCRSVHSLHTTASPSPSHPLSLTISIVTSGSS
jgi:hypothetical protein